MKEKNYLQTGLKKVFFNPLCDHFFLRRTECDN